MIPSSSRDGYIVLLSILIIGIIATVAVTSALLLGTDSQRTALVVEQSVRASALAEGCAEYALEKLRDDLSYPGDEFITSFSSGDVCEIWPIGGTGNTNRIICAEARSGNASRHIEIIVQSVFPETTVYSWQEVPLLSLCL